MRIQVGADLHIDITLFHPCGAAVEHRQLMSEWAPLLTETRIPPPTSPPSLQATAITLGSRGSVINLVRVKFASRAKGVPSA
jgi:hypothetical protein